MNWELTWILCSTALPEIKSKSKLISEIYIYSFSEGHCKDIRSTSIDISGKKIITRIRSRNKEQSLWMCKVMQNTKLFVHLKISLVNGTKFTDTTKFFYGFFSFCVNVFYFWNSIGHDLFVDLVNANRIKYLQNYQKKHWIIYPVCWKLIAKWISWGHWKPCHISVMQIFGKISSVLV